MLDWISDVLKYLQWWITVKDILREDIIVILTVLGLIPPGFRWRKAVVSWVLRVPSAFENAAEVARNPYDNLVHVVSWIRHVPSKIFNVITRRNRVSSAVRRARTIAFEVIRVRIYHGSQTSMSAYISGSAWGMAFFVLQLTVMELFYYYIYAGTVLGPIIMFFLAGMFMILFLKEAGDHVLMATPRRFEMEKCKKMLKILGKAMDESAARAQIKEWLEGDELLREIDPPGPYY
jgi:hypothetical protein